MFPERYQADGGNFGNIPQALISAVVGTNNARWDFLTDQILKTAPTMVGVYRLNMKTGSDNFRHSAVFGIVKRLINANVSVKFYEPTAVQDDIEGMQRINDLQDLKDQSDIILANRVTDEIADVQTKLFSRDVFNVD